MAAEETARAVRGDGMDTLLAFQMGAINRGKEVMVFDWDKAARLIKESGCADAMAGLHGDWEYTAGDIFRNGAPCRDEYTYLASTWATPEIKINSIITPCYKMQSEAPGWDAYTKWPKSALEILNERGGDNAAD